MDNIVLLPKTICVGKEIYREKLDDRQRNYIRSNRCLYYTPVLLSYY